MKTENNFVGKSEVDAGQSGRGERGREGSDLKTLSQDHCWGARIHPLVWALCKSDRHWHFNQIWLFGMWLFLKVWHLDETLLGLSSYSGSWIPQTSPWVHFCSLYNHQVCVQSISKHSQVFSKVTFASSTTTKKEQRKMKKKITSSVCWKELQAQISTCKKTSISGIQLMLWDPWYLCNRERSMSELVRMPTLNILSQTF